MPYSKRICVICSLDYRPTSASQQKCDSCKAAESWIANHPGVHALPVGLAVLILVAAFGPGAKAIYAQHHKTSGVKTHTGHTQPIPTVTAQQMAATEVMLTNATKPDIVKPVKHTKPEHHEHHEPKHVETKPVVAKAEPKAEPVKVHIDTYKVVNPPKPKTTHKAEPHTTSTKHLASAVSGVTPHKTSSPAPTHSSDGSKVSRILAYARAQIGERYVLGGAGPGVWDCSGLTLMAFGSVGIHIGTHSATNQYITARDRGLLVPYADKRPGDLIFYGNGDMSHVTIYSGNGKMIEAADYGIPVRERSIWGSPYHMVARFT